ncbi:RNA polymerase sigma factor [Flindersiella endophytica]
MLDNELRKTIGEARRRFLAQVAPLRPDLHRYCRRLTGNVWDAEDLLQETLTRAFTAAAQAHQEIERPLAWLLRIAGNTYVDWVRKSSPLPAAVPDSAAAPAPADPAEVRDALAEVATRLPPQERAALVLKDVFDLPLAEIAGLAGTSVGAVKAALHRGRGRLAEPDRAYRPKPDRRVVDALAAAFTAYDLDELARLLLADGVVEVVGAVREEGREQARSGSLRHTLVLETHVRYRAEVRELDGEALVLLFGTRTDGSGGGEALEDVLRVDTADDGVRRLRWYYFCPETLTELAEHWRVPVRTNGYSVNSQS